MLRHIDTIVAVTTLHPICAVRFNAQSFRMPQRGITSATSYDAPGQPVPVSRSLSPTIFFVCRRTDYRI